MNEQVQRGMGGASRARGTAVCCPSCRSEVFRLAPGWSVVNRDAPGAVEQVRACPKCGGVVRAFATAA